MVILVSIVSRHRQWARLSTDHHCGRLRPESPSLSWGRYLLLGEDDSAQQLLLQAPHGDGEVDDGGPGTDLRRVGGVGQLGGHVEPETPHHVHLLVPHLHLRGGEEMEEGEMEEGEMEEEELGGMYVLLCQLRHNMF